MNVTSWLICSGLNGPPSAPAFFAALRLRISSVIAEVGESGEFYMVFVTTVILIAVLYFLQKWWTTYR